MNGSHPSCPANLLAKEKRFVNVRAQFVRRGYTPGKIAEIFGGDWMRLYREAWNA